MTYQEKFLAIDKWYSNGLLTDREYRDYVWELIVQCEVELSTSKKRQQAAEAYIESIIEG